MPASRVALTVRYEAEVDGMLCGSYCPQLPKYPAARRYCKAFRKMLYVAVHKKPVAMYCRCQPCLEAEQAGKVSR